MLSQDLNAVISTAFQSVNMEYPTISATTNGFLNPLKVLLSSRSAMVRLGGVDSEIKTVLAACLGPDSGVNYANVHQLVMNAGNTGATAARSIAINGVNPTALGALLFQAASNTNGMVNDPGLSGTNILSCNDAANKVADDITNALNSVEFTRVIQGAVNGMDQPVPGADYSFNSVAAKYNAVATANTLGGVFTGGAAQANAEFMNLLFAELVQSDLNCLKASGDMLTNCQATALQAAEIERNNMQQAAAEVPMLRYAGNFGNYLIALIIGLGPVILMFMMFLGVEAGKSVKTAAHIMVWPLLVVNVGAELVNAMLSIDVANFLQSLRQGGWISQASTLAAYKQLSLQIGVGSHIMASLPVLMSLIFGLGESSAMTSVATTIAPKSHETADNVAPAPSVTRPMFENSSVGRATQLPNGQANLAMNGALEAVSSSATFGNLSRDASRVLTKAQTQSASIEAGQSNMRQWAAAAQKHDFSGFGIDNSIGEQIVKGWEARRNASRNQHSGTGVTGARANENTTSGGMHAGASAGISSGEGFGFSLSAGGNMETSTTASDRLQATRDAGTNASYDDSKALSDSIHDTLSATRHTSAGQQAAKDLTQTLQTQESYQQTLSEVKSVSDATASALHESSNFVQASAQIKAPELLWQSRANPEFAAFSALEGRKFDESAAAKPYLQLAQADASHGATDRVVNSPEGQQLVNRHRAAVLMAQDQSAPAADRAMALNYLTQEGQAMQHMRFTPGEYLGSAESRPASDAGLASCDIGDRCRHRNARSSSCRTHHPPRGWWPHAPARHRPPVAGYAASRRRPPACARRAGPRSGIQAHGGRQCQPWPAHGRRQGRQCPGAGLQCRPGRQGCRYGAAHGRQRGRQRRRSGPQGRQPQPHHFGRWSCVRPRTGPRTRAGRYPRTTCADPNPLAVARPGWSRAW
jgi:conjugal transfer mating pair stabilization protein TraG